MSVVYRDRYGVEYESVPLPTHEVTQAVPLEARIVSRRAERKDAPFYAGTDGTELAVQPRSHRKRWGDAQWGAFEEHRHLEAEQSQANTPIASVVIIKPTSSRRGSDHE